MRKNFLPWTEEAFEVLRVNIMKGLENKVEKKELPIKTIIKEKTKIEIQSTIERFGNTQPSQIIEIDLLEGLTDNQKHMVKGLVATGQYSPMGFTVNITNGDVWYMRKLIARCI